MNMRIALGTALIFTLGSAVGSTSLNVHNGADDVAGSADPSVSSTEVTPEVLAMWKATAASFEYTPPRLPI